MIPRGFISITRFETPKIHLQNRHRIAPVHQQGAGKGRFGAPRVVLQLQPTEPRVDEGHGATAVERVLRHAIKLAFRLDKTPLRIEESRIVVARAG